MAGIQAKRVEKKIDNNEGRGKLWMIGLIILLGGLFLVTLIIALRSRVDDSCPLHKLDIKVSDQAYVKIDGKWLPLNVDDKVRKDLPLCNQKLESHKRVMSMYDFEQIITLQNLSQQVKELKESQEGKE